MYIEWTQELSVNNSPIDAEHQKWISILNNFYVGLQDGQPKERLKILITEMIDYTRFHFANEEKYMESINYPHLEEHKVLHKQYVNQIITFWEKIENNKLILSLEVTNFLKNWLIAHIKGEDQKYSRFAETLK